ncbi:MAG: 30S ribosomal protein S8 [Rickettsiales bacterium]|jgi:small subunit ribosomal protein S8|nr:30S ribosomal protein S8 [Rickettsiales bacterium]
MALTHPIGDMITRIRNGQDAGKETVSTPYSSLRANVLSVLKDEGFIADFRKVGAGENKSDLEVQLKYVDGAPAIQEIAVVSKPSRRAYFGIKKMPRVMSGLGIAIVSTPNGVMTDARARAQNVGGEVLCRVV